MALLKDLLVMGESRLVGQLTANKIQVETTPTTDSDVATKKYVDDAIAAFELAAGQSF